MLVVVWIKCEFVIISRYHRWIWNKNNYSQSIRWCYFFFCYHPSELFHTSCFSALYTKIVTTICTEANATRHFYSAQWIICQFCQSFNELKQSSFKIKLKAHKSGCSLILELWLELCWHFSYFIQFFISNFPSFLGFLFASAPLFASSMRAYVYEG